LLKVQEDESIHSLIYRTHVINGLSDFSNIISTQGHWHGSPHILKDTLQFYDPIDDSLFLKLLRDFGLGEVEREVFKNPFSYVEDLEKFFGCYKGVNKTKKPTSIIAYCLECIRESIVLYGFGFFHITWHANSHCFKHKTILSRISFSSRTESIKNIATILRGEHPEKYSTPTYSSFSFHDWRDYRKAKIINFYAPCLVDKFQQFILNKRKKSKTILGMNYSSEYHVTNRYVMVHIYNYLKKNQPKLFKNYWNRYVKEIEVNTGVFNQRKIKEDLYKFANSDCSMCRVYDCNANLGIIKLRVNNRFLEACAANQMILTDYCKNVRGVYGNSEIKTLIEKMTIEEKSSILSSINGDYSLRKYKIALDNSIPSCAEPYLL
jgi:hypothetical protein